EIMRNMFKEVDEKCDLKAASSPEKESTNSFSLENDQPVQSFAQAEHIRHLHQAIQKLIKVHALFYRQYAGKSQIDMDEMSTYHTQENELKSALKNLRNAVLEYEAYQKDSELISQVNQWIEDYQRA